MRWDPDSIRRIAILAIYKFAVLAGLQFLLYAAEGAAPDYFVGLLSFDHVRGDMFFWFPTLIWNVLRHFRFYKVAERMRRDAVLVALVFVVYPRLIGPRLLAPTALLLTIVSRLL